MNPLTKAAKHNIRAERFVNYTIAAVCGTILGVMLAWAI